MFSRIRAAIDSHFRNTSLPKCWAVLFLVIATLANTTFAVPIR